ncbi:MAG: bestrophin family ion channel [Nannocystaceae bacterium]
MIISSDKPSWLRIVLTYSGSALHRIWLRLLLTTLLAVVVTELYIDFDLFHFDLTITPFSLIGLALSIFLGFRNNTSYDRFWEGRKLWGRLVNTSRSLTRQILTLIGPRPQEGAAPPPELADARRRLVYRLIAYVHALRLHLRDQGDLDALAPFLDAAEREALAAEINRPIALLQRLGDDFRELWDRGWIDTMHLPVLEASLTALADIQGGCERIKSTPIPFSYTVLIHRIVAVYCLGLPFGIIDTVGVFTPVVVMMVAYAFFGLDAVGDEIEDPFGLEPNDLPLSALSRMIEVNLRQRLGERDLPPLLRPEKGLLA